MAHRSRLATDIVTALADMKQPIDMEDTETASAVFGLIQDVMSKVEDKRARDTPPGGWSHYEFLKWQDRMFPGLNSSERAQLVSGLLRFTRAKETQYREFHELLSGKRKVTLGLRQRCEQAEAARKGES